MRGATRLKFYVVVVLGLSFAVARGQTVNQEASPAPEDKAPRPSTRAAPQVQLMTTAEKGVEIQRLIAALQGTWSVSEEHANGSTSIGKEVWRPDAAGNLLIQEYELESAAGKKTNGFAIIWWDASEKSYKGMWCSNFDDRGCSPFNVKWEGDEIEFTGVYLDMGRRIAWKEMFDFVNPTSFVQLVEMAKEGEKLDRVATIRAKRLDKATTPPEPSPE